MSPVQTTYSANIDAAFEGQLSDFGLKDINSKVAEGSDIDFGRVVVAGTSPKQAKLPSAFVSAIEGITCSTTAWTQEDNDNKYQQYREMNILEFGRMWVYFEDAVSKGDDVYFRFAAGSETVLGRFRTDDDDNTCAKIQAKVETSGSAGTLQRIKLFGLGVEFNELETVAAAGALSLYTKASNLETTGAIAITLADGVEGQEKTIVMTVDGGDATLTPANLTGGTTITFGDVGDGVLLRFVDGSWSIISNNGAVVA